MAYLMLMLGLATLTVGAELLVRGASKLAVSFGITPLVVGLTVVAYGTSTPELVVSVQSTLVGQPDVALGNVIGSNIFNVLFILGVSALIVPLRVSQQLIRVDVPLMIFLSMVVMILSIDGRIGRIDGALFTLGLIAYTVWAILKSRKEQAAIVTESKPEFDIRPAKGGARQTLLNGVLVIMGLGLLVLGSRWFVDSAITLARDFRVPEFVIGLTIVAAGTSLPEVATSIMAAIRGERDIAVGNVVGSNIFNLMGVLGISSVVSADGIAVSETVFRLDLPVMVAVAVACLPIFFTGHLIARWEGGLFLAYYVAYTGYLVVATTLPNLTRSFGVVIIGFVAPLTLLTLMIGVVRHLRPRKEADPSSENRAT